MATSQPFCHSFVKVVYKKRWPKIREEVGSQLCVAGLIFAALSDSYSASTFPLHFKYFIIQTRVTSVLRHICAYF
ncbi:hypothetical protein L1987_05832 [Smallanthus sonchifolius]|uniref:Uncharacterized protein n=1 Tax=Smallanthus sonchifolius TaxID=185202 RepID=A0ACB9JWU9_9ASTR|nr:hypothetical protein L1987_05832 [Smallanthus sonchifolius]